MTYHFSVVDNTICCLQDFVLRSFFLVSRTKAIRYCKCRRTPIICRLSLSAKRIIINSWARMCFAMTDIMGSKVSITMPVFLRLTKIVFQERSTVWSWILWKSRVKVTPVYQSSKSAWFYAKDCRITLPIIFRKCNWNRNRSLFEFC